jgi:ankyrin repeat protein
MVVLVLFLFSGSVFAKHWNQKMLNAAKDGDMEGIKAALTNGADVNARSKAGKTPLGLAIGNGNIEILKLLNSAGGK